MPSKVRDRAYGKPVLKYLVEEGEGSGMYRHPNFFGLHGGLTAWSSPHLHFQCHKDAAEFARTIPNGDVVKLRLYARQEPIRPARFL